MVDFPYLPKDRTILYVPLKNPYLQEAKKTAEELMTCSWWPTGAVVVKNEKVIGRGNNWSDGEFVPPCARYLNKCETGEGYDLCVKFCKNKSFSHAEFIAVENAVKNGNDPNGADVYLFGHWWACKACWDKMIEHGIKNLYLLKNAREIFTHEARAKLQEKFIKKIANKQKIDKKEANWKI